MHDVRFYWFSLHDRVRGRLSAVGYSALGEGFNRVTYGLRLGAAERLLRRAGPPRVGTLLEAGVGVGAYEPLWRRIGVADWTGLDLSPTAVADLRGRFPAARFEVLDIGAGDWTALPGSFDLVTAIDVLYHVTDEPRFGRALAELGRRVAGGGALLVSDIFAPQGDAPVTHVKRRPL